MNTSKFIFSVIAFQESDGSWIGQCLQYDVAAQAKTLPDLQYEIQRVLVSHLAIGERLNREPFEGIGQAPRHYWDMYDGSEIRIVIERENEPFSLPDARPYNIVPTVKVAAQHVPH